MGVREAASCMGAMSITRLSPVAELDPLLAAKI